MSEQEIEKEIQDKGLTAPRITPERLDEVIGLLNSLFVSLNIEYAAAKLGEDDAKKDINISFVDDGVRSVTIHAADTDKNTCVGCR